MQKVMYCDICCLLIAMCIDEPNVPQSFKGNESVGSETYMVSWEPPIQSDTTRPVTYYLIKLQLAADEQTEMTIRVPNNQTWYTFTDLLPGNRYHASIAAYNQVGSSDYTTLLAFTTRPTGT